MRNVTYRPDTYEESSGLLAETLTATLFDGRVVSVALRNRGLPTDPEKSLCEIAMQGWQDVLPIETSAWRNPRLQIGWIEADISEIVRLLEDVARELEQMSIHVVISGTSDTLLRHRAVVLELINRWKALLD
jgi:hypothetical protein